MSEATTRQRIARMWAEINGVRTPYMQIPRVLQDAELPGSVIFPGAATFDTDTLGDQLSLDTRIYEMVLYIEKALFDTEGQGQINTDPFFDAVHDHFLARPGLELNSERPNQVESAFEARLLGDNGLQVGPYPIAGQNSPDYLQIRWRLQVKEIAAIAYQD